MTNSAISWILAAPAGLLLADFASGLIHWIIDRYCSPSAPLAGPHFFGLIHEHHRKPFAMFKLSLLRRNAGFVVLVGSLFVLFWLMGWLNPTTCVAFAFGATANQIHCWSHRSPPYLKPLLKPLQSLGVLQSPRHHGVHHGAHPNRCYCLITNFVNPAVDAIELWRWGELVLECLGLPPKEFVVPNPAFSLEA